jgi:predicted transposase/invertase (TIGR01784 family)
MKHPSYTNYPDPLSICNDAVFKAVFTKDIPESKTALKSLLSAFLEREILDLNITANEPSINDLRDRLIRFDISVRFNDGELANVEMTVNPKQDEALRFEYYTARLFITQEIRGKDRSFRDLMPSYHLSFLCENLYPDREWLHRFVYYDPENRMKMGGRTVILTVELKKFMLLGEAKPAEKLDCLERWGFYMVYYRVYEKHNILQKIITMDDGIAAADKVMQSFTEDQQEALAALARDKFDFDAREELHDMKRAARAEGLAEGRAEGREEGRAESLEEIARNALAKGIALELINDITGLGMETLKNMKAGRA